MDILSWYAIRMDMSPGIIIVMNIYPLTSKTSRARKRIMKARMRKTIVFPQTRSKLGDCCLLGESFLLDMLCLGVESGSYAFFLRVEVFLTPQFRTGENVGEKD